MTLSDLKGVFKSRLVPLIEKSIDGNGASKFHIKGAFGAAQTISGTVLFEAGSKHVVFVLSDKEEAAYFLNDIENLLEDKEQVFFFPDTDRKPYELDERDNANIALRAKVLNQIREDDGKMAIVTYPDALSEKVVTKEGLGNFTLEIKDGDKLSTEFLNEFLLEYHFDRVDYVYEPGQFSIRGGIVDVFSFANEFPCRVELFGDEVDSIRYFDPANQLSKNRLKQVTIIPDIEEKIGNDQRESFLQYLPKDSVLWFNSISFALDKIESNFELAKKLFERKNSPVEYSLPEALYTCKDQILKQLFDFTIVEVGEKTHFSPDLSLKFNTQAQPRFAKNFDLLAENLQENSEKKKYTNLIVATNPKQLERIEAIFEDKGADVKYKTLQLNIHQGFVDNDLKLACYTDHQIFERYHRFYLKEGFKKTKEALTLKELYNLQKGDFITHIDHGVGRFSGLEKIDVNGKEQEALRILYKNNDILYVSIHSLHRITRYTGKEGTEPKLNKLGSPVWQNLKQKTKSRVKEIAYDLIAVYARRKLEKGFQYSPDTYLQNELEASFEYEDTPDQLKATNAVKKDMESEAPMDRLVCGDVGFGKTEIAIRAAFKAVADNKQVAVLVPTTLLSFQHNKTFKKRLKDFPCNIDYINRFKTGQKLKDSLVRLEKGETDIIIGTHKIVGTQVKFKDLGLLIIDEEQKFGVAVKDKLKTLKANVDTITLTATPIPRTLQFSMLGARDLSIINTAPANRQPVHTEIASFNEIFVKEAIDYEVSRGGQVFFVHNRVQNIHKIADVLRRICPGVKVVVGHGQMEGPKLEEIMLDFMDGMYDVLVATTIVESGIDIPNANTMMVNDAQNFGLSDLHQLRGRVGRSNKKAFCYLLAPPLTDVTEEARRRLNAIVQFSDLGSGFNIAMRDLDIRGAGDLLGGDQSGFINEMGYETYQKILAEVVEELRENEFKDVFEDTKKDKEFKIGDCIIETDLKILVPDQYVSNINERLSLYQELNKTETEEELLNFKNNLKDRFGEVPEETLSLIKTIKLRWIAKDIGFEKLILKKGKLIGYFIADQDSKYYSSKAFTKVLEFVKNQPKTVKLAEKNAKLSLVIPKIHTVDKAIEWLSMVKDQVIA